MLFSSYLVAIFGVLATASPISLNATSSLSQEAARSESSLELHAPADKRYTVAGGYIPDEIMFATLSNPPLWAWENWAYASAFLWALGQRGDNGDDMKQFRNLYAQKVMEYAGRIFPGANMVLYKRYMGFTMEWSDPIYVKEGLLGEKNYLPVEYSIMIFNGEGTFKFNGADGGWINRAYAGNYEAIDDGIHFGPGSYSPPQPEMPAPTININVPGYTGP